MAEHRWWHWWDADVADVLVVTPTVCGPPALPATVQLVLTQETDIMTTVLTIADTDTTPLTASFGAERDALGNPVTDDPVVSAVWTCDNTAVLSGSTTTDGLTARFVPTGATGVASITATATTKSGATIIGHATVNVGAGPVASIDLALTPETTPSATETSAATTAAVSSPTTSTAADTAATGSAATDTSTAATSAATPADTTTAAADTTATDTAASATPAATTTDTSTTHTAS
jgi:hypothetical protein